MANAEHLQDHCHIQIDGKSASEPVLRAIMQVTVEQGLHLPSLCLLRLQDDELDLVDGSTFDVGCELHIEMGTGNQLRPVFDGEITGLELQPTPAGIFTLLVRAYDRSHRLRRGRQTRSFVQVSDSDIATRIAHEVGLRPDVQATGEVYDYVLQDNRSNYQFLRERAERVGFAFWVADGRLHFRRPAARPPTPIALEWGPTLQYFHPVLSAGSQVDEIMVRGWDPAQKRTIVGRASSGRGAPEISGQRAGSQVASGAFGPAQSVVVHRPVRTQAEADALAQALCDEFSGAFVRAEGQATGTAELCPGKLLEIRNVGERFSGKYYVTAAVHTISNRARYRTRFTVSGTQAQTLLDLVQRSEEHRNWVCVGIVTDNRDPDGLGRVRVKLPWLGDQVQSTWARISAPMAGGGRGFFFLPEVNDEVLVAFEHGEVSRAYVLGALWNGLDTPPGGDGEAVDGSGRVVKRVIRSRAGHTILLEDSQGGEKVEITDKDGAKIVMNQSGIEVSKGSQSVKLTQSSVTVNDGALEVV